MGAEERDGKGWDREYNGGVGDGGMMRTILPRAIGSGVLGVLLLFGGGAGLPASASDEFPSTTVTMVNDTGQAADGIVVNVDQVANFGPISENPPGCDEPSYEYGGGWPYISVSVVWPTACVDAGESVEFTFYRDCTDCGAPGVGAHTWYSGGFPVSNSATLWGIVCVDAECGDTATGLDVVAMMGDVECGRTETGYPHADGFVFAEYEIAVASDQVQGCGTPGAPIDVYIDGVRAKQTPTWALGRTHLDIWTGVDFMRLEGDLTCSGEPCYDCPTGDCYSNVRVEAYIGTVFCGITVPFGYYIIPGRYAGMNIDSAEDSPGCGTPGAEVHFTIDGVPAEETIAWQPGWFGLSLSVSILRLIWGDIDCDHEVTSRDAQGTLRLVLDQPPLSGEQPCPAIGTLFNAGLAGPIGWGDWDCDGDVTTRDAQFILKAVVGWQYVLGQCASPGDPVFAS